MNALYITLEHSTTTDRMIYDEDRLHTAASGNPVAEILEALMSKHRLNQTELAHRSGVSQPAINRILRERSKAKHPRQDTLEKLAAELGVTPDQLAGREPISAHMLARGVVPVLRLGTALAHRLIGRRRSECMAGLPRRTQRRDLRPSRARRGDERK
jgi:transcriptional regulator with XRE-family HTH domain